MKTLRVYLFAALTLRAGNCIAQNLLTNGSFESVAYPSNHIASLSAGTTNLPGWVLQGTGSGSIMNKAPFLPGWGCLLYSFTASDGKQFFQINNSALTLSQSFATEPGEIYEVAFSGSFFLDSPAQIDPQIIAQVFSTNNAVLGALSASVPGPLPSWVSFRFRFAATAPISTLQFYGTNATGLVAVALDDVSVRGIARGLTIDVSQVRLCWASETNRTYQIQYSTNLAANGWTDLGAPIPGIGGIDCTYQQVLNPQRFYRVALVP
jgi:hypothetical protein